MSGARAPRSPAISRALVAALVATLANACVPPPDPLAVNHAPVARVVVPQLWPLSEPASVDGSLSDDSDGDPLAFSVDWGDGTPSAQDDDGIAQHTFAAPGTYTIALTVEDADGVPVTAQAPIVVVGDSGAGCSCDLGCFDDAVCTERGCLLFRSSTSGEEAPTGAFADAVACHVP